MFFVKNLPSAVDAAVPALCRPAGAAFSGSNGREIATFSEKIYSIVDYYTMFCIYSHIHADAE